MKVPPSLYVLHAIVRLGTHSAGRRVVIQETAFSAGAAAKAQCRIAVFHYDSLSSFDFRRLSSWRTDAKDMNMKMSVIEAVSFA